MLSNQEIVTYVYYNYKIMALVHKLVDTSRITGWDGHLESYIYETLLTYDNFKLNKMFEDKTLKQFIARIIINQRNSGKYYNKYLKNRSLEYVEVLPDMEYEESLDEDELDIRPDFIMDELFSISWYSTGMTQEVMRRAYGYELLKLYYIKGLSKLQIMIEFKIGLSTFNLLIKEGKNNLKNNFLKKNVVEL